MCTSYLLRINSCFLNRFCNRMQTSIQKMNNKNSNIHQSNKNSKKTTAYTQQQEFALLNDTLKLIDSLFQLRFIETISRPIQKRVKEQYVQKFAGKMQNLHYKLQKIRAQISERSLSENGNSKGKSVIGSATHKPLDWKKSIRSIENRYTQVLIEGSFKHYPKLYHLNSFLYPLKTIDIEDWANKCINQQNKQSSCCC